MDVVSQLAQNGHTFRTLMEGVVPDMQQFRPELEKWNLLEILCHLLDEEREDFRTRVHHCLFEHEQPMPSIDPQGWVTSRRYGEQDYGQVLGLFLNARIESVRWLRSLSDPQWGSAYQHPKFGSMTAELFLTNWLAHDYLHIRQIIQRKYQYLEFNASVPLDYAGNW